MGCYGNLHLLLLMQAFVSLWNDLTQASPDGICVCQAGFLMGFMIEDGILERRFNLEETSKSVGSHETSPMICPIELEYHCADVLQLPRGAALPARWRLQLLPGPGQRAASLSPANASACGW